jgi:hypothetical protein
MKKSLIIFSLTLGIVFFLYKIYTSQPEYLAANYMRVPDFFSLPSSEFNYSNPTVCLDELHSQGRKFEDFGSAFYMLRISEKHPNLREILSDFKNVVRTDSSFIITKRRGNILGTFELKHNSSIAYVHYEQLYDD